MDNVIKNILEEVQKELKKERNVDISIEELYNICISQFKVANLGFKKGIEIRLPIFGSFISNNKLGVIERIKEIQKVHKDKSEKEIKEILNKEFIALKEQKKAKNKIRNKKESNHTLEDLKNTPDLVNIPNKYDKYVNKNNR